MEQLSPNPELLARRLLDAIDAANWTAVEELFALDASYSPPEMEPILGRPAIVEYCRTVRPIARGVHSVSQVWNTKKQIIVNGRFSGVSRMGETICLEFVDVLKIDDGLIRHREVSVKPLDAGAVKVVDLQTDRLLLRKFSYDDAADVARVAGAREIADTTISVPHPLTLYSAREWILSDLAACSKAQRPFAVIDRESGVFLGACALRDMSVEHGQAELSFWFDKSTWGRGYATEAAGCVIGHTVKDLGIHRLVAFHLARNPASGRVLTRLRFHREAVQPARVRKWGQLEDVWAWAYLVSRN